MANEVKQLIRNCFLDMADALESGRLGGSPKVALTGLGSEHGEDNTFAAALAAVKKGVNVYYIGTKEAPGIVTVKAETEDQAHEAMSRLLKEGTVDAAVTMHFPFPIGVSTVGRAVTPGMGREMFIATTTGTAAADRVNAMVLGALYGIIAAKACGNQNPTVGILNLDGARQAEMKLKELQKNGFPITFAESKRSDGGCIFRGNDVLTGAADILVTDSLTGNVLTKMLSSFSSGGLYETVGYGYGPGIGEAMERPVLIVSRASGAKVIENALVYAAEVVAGDIAKVAKETLKAAKAAKLDDLLKKGQAAKKAEAKEVSAPPKEIVDDAIAGVDVMDLEDAVHCLWAKGIYAESGMGCTGPVVMVNAAKISAALDALKAGGFVGA